MTTTVPLPPPTSTSGAPPLEFSRPSIEPGGQLTVIGNRCSPGADVRLAIGTATVGTAVADTQGGFSAPISVPDLPLGRYEVVAGCGGSLVGPIDVVIATSVDGGTGTLGLFFFFLLLVLMLFRRRRLVFRRHRHQTALPGETT